MESCNLTLKELKGLCSQGMVILVRMPFKVKCFDPLPSQDFWKFPNTSEFSTDFLPNFLKFITFQGIPDQSSVTVWVKQNQLCASFIVLRLFNFHTENFIQLNHTDRFAFFIVFTSVDQVLIKKFVFFQLRALFIRDNAVGY